MAGGIRMKLRSLSRTRSEALRFPFRQGLFHAVSASPTREFPSTGQ